MAASGGVVVAAGEGILPGSGGSAFASLGCVVNHRYIFI